MVEISQNRNNLTPINVTSASSNRVSPTFTSDLSAYYSQLSREWATKMDGKIDRIDYSSKYYAQKAKTDTEAALTDINITIQSAKNDLSNQTALAIESLDTEGDIKIAEAAEQVTLAAAQAQAAQTSAQEAESIIQNSANLDLSNITDNAKNVIKQNGGVWGFIQGEINNQPDLANKLANKANLDLSNSTRPYVIEKYTNDSSWYRLWSDGFIEQGGTTAAFTTYTTVTFLKPFKDFHTIVATQRYGVANTSTVNTGVMLSNTVRLDVFNVNASGSGTFSAYWYACGY